MPTPWFLLLDAVEAGFGSTIEIGSYGAKTAHWFSKSEGKRREADYLQEARAYNGEASRA